MHGIIILCDDSKNEQKRMTSETMAVDHSNDIITKKEDRKIHKDVRSLYQ